jgi:hypothetical protein
MFIMPYLLRCFFQAVYLKDPILRKMIYDVFVQGSPWWWPLRGRRTHSIPKHLRGKEKLSMRLRMEAITKSRLWAYLVPVAFSIFKDGCCVEGWLRECPKPFTGIEEHCLGNSTRVGADY